MGSSATCRLASCSQPRRPSKCKALYPRVMCLRLCVAALRRMRAHNDAPTQGESGWIQLALEQKVPTQTLMSICPIEAINRLPWVAYCEYSCLSVHHFTKQLVLRSIKVLITNAARSSQRMPERLPPNLPMGLLIPSTRKASFISFSLCR